MKFSIITLTNNSHPTILCNINSILSQNYSDYEHIIIDNLSSDGTCDLIKSFNIDKLTLISERDSGIYNAMNKGVSISTGDVICFLHSDDYYASNNILEVVNSTFIKNPSVNVIYGNLKYINADGNVIRNWLSNVFKKKYLYNGWMPPHPTLFIKKSLFDSVGFFDESYSISSDYDFIIRLFKNENCNSLYINLNFINMRLGGVSNSKLFRKIIEDYRIIKKNKLFGFYTLVLKNLSKLNQFFR